MKKRLVTLCLIMVFSLIAAFPVYADEGWLFLERSDIYTVSSDLVHGSEISDLYMEVLSSSYEVYYAFYDQNDNLLVDGWLYPGWNPILQFSNGNTPLWWPNFPSSVTDIRLEMTCNGAWGGCEGSANFYAR